MNKQNLMVLLEQIIDRYTEQEMFYQKGQITLDKLLQSYKDLIEEYADIIISRW